jgi:hypothetical protein
MGRASLKCHRRGVGRRRYLHEARECCASRKTSPYTMSDLVLPLHWKVLGWLATAAMAMATIAMFITML